MAEEKQETQVVPEDPEEEIKTAAVAAVPEQVTQKRATVASVKREIDGLRNDVETDVLDWLGNLDVRLEAMEKRTAQHNEALLGDVKARLEILEREEKKTIIEVADDVAARINALEDATDKTVQILRSHITDTGGQPPAAAAAAGPTMAPTQPAGETTQTNDIREIAAHCQTMADVLLICRMLKARQNITDEERSHILDCACQIAGVTMTQGLQIRAGVKNPTW